MIIDLVIDIGPIGILWLVGRFKTFTMRDYRAPTEKANSSSQTKLFQGGLIKLESEEGYSREKNPSEVNFFLR